MFQANMPNYIRGYQMNNNIPSPSYFQNPGFNQPLYSPSVPSMPEQPNPNFVPAVMAFVVGGYDSPL
jgi:hypothetical protein